MELLSVALWGIAVFTVMGLFFGVALAATARKFHVPSNPMIDEVRENLPAANCGACGYAGCQGYAEAVVNKSDVKPTLCTPGGVEVAEIVADITHKEMDEMTDQFVMLRCFGTTPNIRIQAQYDGIQTCSAAILAFGGPKACKYACLGMADCERACPFDAIHVKDKGIAEVDFDKCTGCALCVSACPKDILIMYPRNHRVELSCVAADKASIVRPTCLIGCTLCQKCVPACPAEAITFEDKTIMIDHKKCLAYGPSCKEACVDICPTFILHRIGQTPKPEETDVENVGS